MTEDKKDDALASFENDKARVLDFARELKNVAIDRGDAESAETLESLTRRFEENRFLVVSVGSFKTGKSTLMNALAGRVVCPMRSTPHTARLTRIMAAKGDRETIEVHYKAEKPPLVMDFSEAALTNLVSMKGEGKGLEEVASVDVAVKPTGLLVQKEIVLVDSPGLESIIGEHDRITRDFLPRADLVLFYLTAKQILGARERDFLLSHPDVLKKCLIVVTHIDAVPADELEEVLEFTRRGLKESVLGSARELELFPVSGRRALDGILEGKPELVEQSLVPKLVARITEILTIQRGVPILASIAEAERNVALGLAKQVNAARSVQRTKITGDVKDRSEKLKRDLRTQSAALEAKVVREIDEECRGLSDAVPVQVGTFREQLKAEVWTWIEGYPNEEVCKQQLPTQLAHLTQGWLDRQEQQLRRQFKRITQQANTTSSAGFAALQEQATATFQRDKAFPAIAEIAGGLEALSDLNAIAACMGGPIGGYGLATAAIEPVFAMPPAIKAMTVGASLLSVVAFLGGPIGWGAAVVGWLAVGIANLVRSSTWRTRAFAEMEKAIDNQIIPRVGVTIGTEVWKFGRALQDHMGAHIRRVHGRLADVVQTLVGRVEAGRAEDEGELRALDEAEKRLLSIAERAREFLAGLPSRPESTSPEARESEQ